MTRIADIWPPALTSAAIISPAPSERTASVLYTYQETYGPVEMEVTVVPLTASEVSLCTCE